MAKKYNTNTTSYIGVATLINDKITKLTQSYDANQEEFNYKTNTEISNLRSGLVRGLTNLGKDKRSNLYREMCEIRENYQLSYYYCEMQSSKNTPVETTFDIMKKCSMVIEGVDYLETILQINFPTEFPNELLDELFLKIGKENSDLATETLIKDNDSSTLNNLQDVSSIINITQNLETQESLNNLTEADDNLSLDTTSETPAIFNGLDQETINSLIENGIIKFSNNSSEETDSGSQIASSKIPDSEQ